MEDVLQLGQMVPELPIHTMVAVHHMAQVTEHQLGQQAERPLLMVVVIPSPLVPRLLPTVVILGVPRHPHISLPAAIIIAVVSAVVRGLVMSLHLMTLQRLVLVHRLLHL